MSEIEIKQMQEKINAGILLARKRLIEKTKKEDGELVVVRDGKVVRIKAKDLKLRNISSAIRSGIFYIEIKATENCRKQTNGERVIHL